MAFQPWVSKASWANFKTKTSPILPDDIWVSTHTPFPFIRDLFPIWATPTFQKHFLSSLCLVTIDRKCERERAATVHPRGKKRIRERQKFFWFRPWVEVRQREAVSELHPSALLFYQLQSSFQPQQPPSPPTTTATPTQNRKPVACLWAERRKTFSRFSCESLTSCEVIYGSFLG